MRRIIGTFPPGVVEAARRRNAQAGLGYPLYVNGKLFPEPVTISHVPGVGALDPSMGALGQYVAYAPHLPPLGAAEILPGSSQASLPPGAPAPPPAPSTGASSFLKIWSYLALPSSLACAYHGYKRNDSVLWALWWGLVGSMPITPIIAVAQGFGKRKGMTANRGKKRRSTRRTLRRASRGLKRGQNVHTPSGTGKVVEVRGGEVGVAVGGWVVWFPKKKVTRF